MAAMTDHDFIDKKALSERNICTKFITPAIKEVAGWSITQFYEEFTLGEDPCAGETGRAIAGLVRRARGATEIRRRGARAAGRVRAGRVSTVEGVALDNYIPN